MHSSNFKNNNGNLKTMHYKADQKIGSKRTTLAEVKINYTEIQKERTRKSIT